MLKKNSLFNSLVLKIIKRLYFAKNLQNTTAYFLEIK
ncbi:hypothetical protein MHA_2575 [Mannheimia haemolytica PHL213]|nr:hypothetical protein MHA_2575 [Mannheimia haemolytica PHL213]